MRALTVRANGGVGVEDLDEIPGNGELLVAALALGICATDRWVISRSPKFPAGRDRIVLGHETLGRVLRAPVGSPLESGELVVGTVRRPDPVPCPACAAGESDLCQNDGYLERGIRSLDGFGSERYFLEPDNAIHVDESLGLAGVLLEPASIVAKAWEQVDRVARSVPRRVLVQGAGPIGLLAALFAARRGYEVHVLDQVEVGAKPEQVRRLGAKYHTTMPGGPDRFDVVLECTGSLTEAAIWNAAPGGTACLIGSADHQVPASIAIAKLAQELVVHNKTVVGTVNANRRHFESAHAVLTGSETSWLASLLSAPLPLDDWHTALNPDPAQIKSLIAFNDA